jgi:hypothetical protein
VSIVDKLKFAAAEALADPVLPARLAPFGMELFPHERQTPEALAAMQYAGAKKWWPIIKELGIKPESIGAEPCPIQIKPMKTAKTPAASNVIRMRLALPMGI